jgi:hypothetical protein
MLAAFDGAPLGVTSAVFADGDRVTRLLTVLSVVPQYARLLALPASLSADYEPDVIVPAHTVTPMVIAGAVLVLAFAVLVVRSWRARPVLAFALLWIPIALSPVSNVFFATGIALAERTLYLPSVGASILAGWLAAQVRAVRPAAMAAAVVMVSVLFTARTWTRTPVWRDSRRFALTLVTERPESYRGHWVAGRVLRASGNLAGADRELTIARTIYPRDIVLLRESAEVVMALGNPAVSRALRDSADAIARRRATAGSP